MNKLQKMLLVLVLAFTQLMASAQATVAAPAPTDLMRSNGKIFLVMTIVVVIMSGLLLYVISIDRKIAKLEKK